MKTFTRSAELSNLLDSKDEYNECASCLSQLYIAFEELHYINFLWRFIVIGTYLFGFLAFIALNGTKIPCGASWQWLSRWFLVFSSNFLVDGGNEKNLSRFAGQLARNQSFLCTRFWKKKKDDPLSKASRTPIRCSTFHSAVEFQVIHQTKLVNYFKQTFEELYILLGTMFIQKIHARVI